MVRFLPVWLIWVATFLCLGGMPAKAAVANSPTNVWILPVREGIETPMVHLVRRGVKAAMEAGADCLVLDMDTNGGRIDKTEEIITILGQFKGRTVTFVNRRAFSAGAFISFATQQIYMAPEAVIGAAAPIMMAPGGGPQALPDTVEAKMVSACAALVRASAEKNGHNVEVADAMVRRTKELILDGEVLNRPGEILTLTSQAAAKTYGNPPKPLLSSGTVESIDALLATLGAANAQRSVIRPTGWEQIATWLSSGWVSSILLILGIGGLYIEFKTPGFGLPGIVGIVAFALYFLGGYLAGLSGAEWILVFLVGVVLLMVELFLLQGSIVIGLGGVLLMMVSLFMALADAYPNPGKWLPSFAGPEAFHLPIQSLTWAMLGGVVMVVVLSRVLPRTPVYRELVSQGASGQTADQAREKDRERWMGKEGVAVSSLRPSGKARFGDELLDVVSQGEMIEKGTPLRIVGFSTTGPVVQSLGTPA